MTEEKPKNEDLAELEEAEQQELAEKDELFLKNFTTFYSHHHMIPIIVFKIKFIYIYLNTNIIYTVINLFTNNIVFQRENDIH